jgi:hypothetical protein
VLGRLFAANHLETQETDIILVLTPHVIRVLDLTEADLRPFRVGREGTPGALIELPSPPAPVQPEPGDTAPGPVRPGAAPIRPPVPPKPGGPGH